MPATNRKVVMKQLPVGVPTPADFEVVTESLGDIGEGQMLLKTRWLTLDRTCDRGSCCNQTTWARP